MATDPLERDRGEDPVRLGNVGRGLGVLAAVVFVVGWVGAVWAATDDTLGSLLEGPAIATVVQVGALGTIAAGALLVAGVAYRAFAAWIEDRDRPPESRSDR